MSHFKFFMLIAFMALTGIHILNGNLTALWFIAIVSAVLAFVFREDKE